MKAETRCIEYRGDRRKKDILILLAVLAPGRHYSTPGKISIPSQLFLAYNPKNLVGQRFA
ncbi:hypothetical protein OZX67_09525 [Bifidobacterium sp. ESL0728]|uniref:hypothetical protein n=1 Tax=Bifidobacterium sp. ESL0728 TaxID=2983220 RepID=UPI0023F947B0|nr:hypothetical protein [Bifidobacterium sp. ESL0728]WEV59004.1 hypothetical protein OZX67_09525 [Bifidobacterium sp. ESL0728]